MSIKIIDDDGTDDTGTNTVTISTSVFGSSETDGLKRSHDSQGASVDPTFLLRGIDIKNIISDYFDGKFENIELPESKVIRHNQQMTPDYDVGKNSDSQIYEYYDLTGKVQRVVTTDHDNYSIVKESLGGNTYLDQLNSGKPTLTELPAGGVCLWCRRQFDHIPVGIPVKSEYFPEINKTVFHVSGVFCTYECSYSFLKSRITSPYNFRDYRYVSSESMLLMMFNKINPNKVLRESPDWILAKWNGGTLIEADFFSDSHVYTRSNNVVMLPTKLEYLVDIS